MGSAKRFLTASKKLECTLLGLVARLQQALQRLLAGRVLLAADNATLLGLHEVLLCQPTTGVLGRSVVDLCLGTDGGHLLTTTEHWACATCATAARGGNTLAQTDESMFTSLTGHITLYLSLTFEFAGSLQPESPQLAAPFPPLGRLPQNGQANHRAATSAVQEAHVDTH